MNTDRQRLKDLSHACVKKGHFILASGKESDFYFNGKMVTLHPEGAHLTAKLMYEVVRDTDATALAGISVGSDPLVSTVGHIAFQEGAPLKMAYIRKQPKEHGTRLPVEGPPLEKDDVVVVLEDVVTTGGSAIKAVNAVKEAYGCRVDTVVCLLDRLEGGREEMAAQNLELKSLFVRTDFD